MNLSLIILAITLVIAASSVGMSYGASIDSYLFQLQNGVDPKDIQCRDDLVLVLRTSDSSACVKESTANKLGWKIIESFISPIAYWFPFTAEKSETTNDTTIDYSVPKLWYGETTLSISTFPKLGETAEVTVIFTNLSHIDTIDIFEKYINVSDKFEIIQSSLPITSHDDGYTSVTSPLTILTTNQTDSITITIKAVKEGEGRISADALDDRASLRLMIGESQTLLYDDWEEKYPELALQKQRDEELADGRVWGTINGEMVILEIAELGDFDIYEERDGIGFDDLPEDVMRDELEQMGYSPKDIDEIIIEIQERKAQNRNTVSPEDSIPYYGGDEINVEPSVAMGAVKLSNLPKLNEVVTFSANARNIFTDKGVNFYLEDSWEFVNTGQEIEYRQLDDGSELRIISNSFTVPNGETETFSIQVKPTELGITRLQAGIPFVENAGIGLFVGEDKTIPLSQYYKENPEEHPMFGKLTTPCHADKSIPDSATIPCDEPTPQITDEMKEHDGVGLSLATKEDIEKMTGKPMGIGDYEGYPKLTDKRYEFYDNVGFVFLEQGHESVTRTYYEDPVTGNSVLNLVKTFGKVPTIVRQDNLISIQTDKIKYNHGDIIQLSGQLSKILQESCDEQYIAVIVQSNNNEKFREYSNAFGNSDCSYEGIIDTSNSRWDHKGIYTIRVDPSIAQVVYASMEIELISEYIAPQRSTTSNDMVLDLSSPVEFVDDGREHPFALVHSPAPRLVYDSIMADYEKFDVDEKGIATFTPIPHEKYSINEGVGFYIEDWIPTVIPDGQKLLYAGTECYEITGSCGLGIQFVPSTFELTPFTRSNELINAKGFHVGISYSASSFDEIEDIKEFFREEFTEAKDGFGEIRDMTRDGKPVFAMAAGNSVNAYRASISFHPDEFTRVGVSSPYYTLDELIPIFDSIMK